MYLMDFQWNSHGFPMEFKWTSNVIQLDFWLDVTRIPIAFAWISGGSPMDSKDFHDECQMDFKRLPDGFLMDGKLIFYDIGISF